MQISAFKSQVSRCFNLLIVIGFVFLSFSCKNFLNGGEISEELKNAIEYANAPLMNVQFSIDSNAGSIKPVDDKKLKVKDKCEVSYSPATNFVFKKWLVLNAKTKNELSDVVSFKDINSASTTMEIKNYVADGIIITPDYYEIPNVTDHYPKDNKSSVSQDSSITISFNYPLSLKDFFDEEMNQFINIEIKSGAKNLIDSNDPLHYFSKPKLENDGKMLVIPVNANNNLISIDDSTKEMEITVSLKLSNIKVNDELTFNNDYVWTYRINNSVDAIAPKLVSLECYKRFADGKISETPLLTSDYSEWTESSQYKANHVHSLALSFDATDTGSGVNLLNIKAQQIKHVDGTTVINPKTYEYSITAVKSENDFYQARKEPLILTSIDDGLIKLEIFATDYAGNPSEVITIYVVKDTSLLPADIKMPEEKHGLTANYSDKFTYYEKGSFVEYCVQSISIDQDFIRTPDGDIDTVIFDASAVIETFYGENTANITIEDIKWGYEDDKSSMTSAVYNPEKITFEIKRNKNYNTHIIFEVMDSVHNKYELHRVIPKTVNPVDFTINKTYKISASTKIDTYKLLSADITVNPYNEFNEYGEEYGVYYLYKHESDDSFVNYGLPDYSSTTRMYDLSSALTSEVFIFNPTKFINADLTNPLYFEACHTTKDGPATVDDFTEFRPSGEYSVYTVSYIKNKERIYFGALSKPLILKVSNDEELKEFEVRSSNAAGYDNVESYLNTCSKKEINHPAINFPEKENVKVESIMGPLGSGIYTIKAEFPKPDDELSYLLCYSKIGTGNIYSNSIEVQVDTDMEKVYTVKLYVPLENGDKELSSYSFTVSCKEDNISPALALNNEISFTYFGSKNCELKDYAYPNYFRYMNNCGNVAEPHYPTDSSKMCTEGNDQGLASINYYLIYRGETEPSPMTYTQKELEKYSEKRKTFLYNPDKVKIEANVDGKTKTIANPDLFENIPYELQEGYYDICFECEDEHHNKQIVSTTACNIIDRNLKPEVKIESSNFVVTNSAALTGDYHVMFLEYMGSDNKWNEYCIYNNYAAGTFINTIRLAAECKTNNLSLKVAASKINDGLSFVKANIKADGKFSNTVYAFPDFYNTAYDEETRKSKYPCLKKSVITAATSDEELFIYCDSPVLIHTLYSPVNLNGLIDGEKNEITWGTKAIEVTGSEKQCNSDFTYDIPVDEVPADSWYTVLIHFADGTTKMLKPVYKDN